MLELKLTNYPALHNRVVGSSLDRPAGPSRMEDAEFSFPHNSERPIHNMGSASSKQYAIYRHYPFLPRQASELGLDWSISTPQHDQT